MTHFVRQGCSAVSGKVVQILLVPLTWTTLSMQACVRSLDQQATALVLHGIFTTQHRLDKLTQQAVSKQEQSEIACADS